MNMTYILWAPGEPRRNRVCRIPAEHEGYNAPCVLCPRPLGGGPGTLSLPLQIVAIGPARGDTDAARKHDQRQPYMCAALVVHQECLLRLTDTDVEKLAADMVMIPRGDILPGRAAS